MSDANIRGRFVWHELMTTDTQAAAAFYKKVIGWSAESWPQDPSYKLFMGRGAMRAGLMILPEQAKAMGAPPSWVSYIGTPSVDETARLAEQLGGRVFRQPSDIPTVGRFAVIADPQGAVFSAFTPGNGSSQGDPKPGLGDFSWHELTTTDWQAAFDFYHRLFGWEKTEAMDMGPDMGVYQMFGVRGNTLGGMFNRPPNHPAPPNWLPYIKVADAKRAAEAATKAGGRVINGPMQVPGGDWIAQGIDPVGAVFAVHSTTPASKPAPKAKPKKAAAKPAKKKPAKKKPAKKAARRKAARKARPAKKRATKKRATKKRATKKRATKKRARRSPPRRAARTSKRKRGARKKR